MEARDIEGCHRFPLSRNSRGHDKKVIAKFVNRKSAEALLKNKKESVLKALGIYMKLTKLMHLSPFSYTIDTSWVSVRICKGKKRYTMFFVKEA